MDDQNDPQEVLRRKRVAKLQPTTPTPMAEEGDSATPISSSRGEPPKITIKPLAAPKSTKPKTEETQDAWTHRTISSVFRIALEESQRKDSSGNRLYYLPDVKSELSDQPLLFTTSILDQAIIEAASQTSDRKPLSYLLGCWKRASRLWRRVRDGKPSDPKYQVVKEVKRLCLSYTIFGITMPDMFGIDTPERSVLAEHLLLEPDSDNGIDPDLLSEVIPLFEEDDTLKQSFIDAFEQLSEDLSKTTMNGNYKPYIAALRNCVRYSQIVSILTDSPKFINKELPAERLEHDTLLGPFFALSPIHADVAANYFMGASVQGEAYIANNQHAIRVTLRTHQDELFEITNSIVKSSKASRECLLDWFALIVNKNHKRRATYVQTKEVSSDGFMVNITSVLDRLCDPFMDATFSKLDRIDVNYLRRSPRVDIGDETKLNANQKTSDEFYAQKDDKENNFISEIFFLTVAAHHYGSEAANNKVQQLQREAKHFEQEIAKFEAERPKYAANPVQLQLFEQRLKGFKTGLEKIRCVIEAIKGVLLDELSQQRSMLLMRYVISWLLRIVQPESQYPKRPITLPLAEEQPLVFKCLPEYFLEDIVDNFKFTTQHIPHLIPVTQCEELVTVCVTFLRSTDYVKNPGLKAGLVSILSHGVFPFSRNRPKGIFGDLLNGSEFCHKHLLRSLMQFYIEAENTGTHNQFYDKFNIRYEIFQIIKCIWSNQIYRQNLDLESKTHPDFFIQFVNLLLNDVTYVLGESFRAFTQIHEIQQVLEDPNNGLDETQKQEKKEQLEDQQRIAKGNMQLTNETIAMLKLFTEALAEAFTAPELVQRLADMLDYNLEAMVGPKQKNLKVKEPERYEFKPALLLADIMSVYVNLRKQPSFHLAVARDGRSYKPYNFKHAAEIMSQTSLKSPEELETWLKLAKTIEKVKEAEDQAEEDLGEIPEEFLDPLLDTLMVDPVILPSKTVIDRSTISTHLLSDQRDPFNRQKMTMADVQPATELKAKIELFKAEAKKKRLEAAGIKETDDNAMDLTP